LRTIQRVKKLKQLLIAIFSALPLLKDAIIILIFFYFIFAIAGLQLFSGLLKKKCFFIDSGILYIDKLSGNPQLCGSCTF